MLSRVIQEVCEANAVEASSSDLSKRRLYILKSLITTGQKSVKDIAEIFGISNPAVSKSVDKLVRDDYVSRVSDDSDRRVVNISITKKGEAAVLKYDAYRLHRQNSVLDHFSFDELIDFNQHIEKFLKYFLEEEDELELVCLQCDGSFAEDCQLRNINQQCFYSIKAKKQSVVR